VHLLVLLLSILVLVIHSPDGIGSGFLRDIVCRVVELKFARSRVFAQARKLTLALYAGRQQDYSEAYSRED
jgi:hypothetical protein